MENKTLGLFIHEQAKEFVRQGHEVHVITTGAINEVLDGVHVYRINPTGLIFSIKCYKKIIELDRKIDFDVIHSHFTGFLTYMANLAANRIRKPFVLTAYGIGLLPGKANFFSKLSLRKGRTIICISRYTEGLVKNLTKSKTLVINPGIDLSKLKLTKNETVFKRESGLENKRVLLSVSDLIKRKGIDTILEALPNVIRKFPDLIYLIIGRGPEEKALKDLAKRLGIDRNVRFLGYVTDRELANYYACCDIFVLMSKTIKERAAVEGFGIVYVEASYFEKPVIGGKSGGTSDAVIEGKTGFLIEPKDKKELTEKIVLLLENEKLRKRLGKQGKKHALDLNWSNNVKKTIELYRTL